MTMKLKFLRSLMVVLAVPFLLAACERGAEKQVNILVPVPLTGDAASYGKIMREGIDLALDELKSDPVSSKLNVIYRDSQLSLKEIVNIFQQECARQTISVVMPVSTGESMVLAPLCNEKKVVLLPPLADGDELVKARPFFFRISPASSFQGAILAKAVKEKGYKDAAILYLNDAWGTGLADTLKREFEAAGGKIAASESVNPNQLDLRIQLTKIKNSGAAALIILVHPTETVPALRQIRELGLTVQIFGGDTFSNKAIFEEVADLAQGVIFALPSEPQNEIFNGFRAAYKKKYNANADVNAAAARDALMIVAKAVREGATDGDSIRIALGKWSQAFQGATGTIQWNEEGNVTTKQYSLYVIKGRSYEPLS